MFSKIINKIQNPKNLLYIIVILSIIFSFGHLNLLGIGFSILAYMGLKNRDLSYIKAFIAYNIIELLFYGISFFIFVIVLIYDIYIIIKEGGDIDLDDDGNNDDEISIIFGFSFLYTTVSLCVLIILAKFFTIELSKKYIEDEQRTKDFSILENGSMEEQTMDTRYSNDNKSSEKLREVANAYIDKFSNSYNENLPPYRK
ncbi:hypothetical protein U3516DRAFT_618680 [Neocallimastix sp. 'constans']